MSATTEKGAEPGREASGSREPSGRMARVVERFRDGEERGLARAISLVENAAPGYEALLDALHEGVGRARRIGITGPPGAGKSTLTAGLARRFREDGLTVGILAVDPTSPFTGGALLGDRVRMTELATEPGIFIRSMASRGSLGGMATASREAADLMDAFGFDRILLETVGVGQSELEIAQACDSTVVVLVPESGDGIQAMKAGLMEVADLFVVNKADRPGADRLSAEIAIMQRIRAGRAPGAPKGHHGAGDGDAVGAEGEADDGSGGAGSAAEGAAARIHADREAGSRPGRPEAPVLQTVASKGEGIEELADALDEHFHSLREGGRLEARRAEHLLEHARAVLRRRFERRADAIWEALEGEIGEAVAEGRLSPYAAADRLEREAGGGPEPA